MKKKIICVFMCMLMIFSATTTILYSNKVKVEASIEKPDSPGVNLDDAWIWDRLEEFVGVQHNTQIWQGAENNIPKGRSWATAGENYTILNILWKNMGKPEFACGLKEYKNLTLGYLPGCYEPHSITPKKYTSKVVIHDFELKLYNNGNLYKEIPIDEMFPYGIGVLPNLNTETRTHFSNAEIKDFTTEPKNYPFSGTYIQDYYTVSGVPLNYLDTPLMGLVEYIQSNETLPNPENQTYKVYIFDEEPSCEHKMENISNNVLGCILIENTTNDYTFTPSSDQHFSVTRVNGRDRNFSLMLNGLKNGIEYFVDNVADNDVLYFSNFSNPLYWGIEPWVGLINLHSQTEAYTSGVNDWLTILGLNIFYYLLPLSQCKGFILYGPDFVSGPNDDTYLMMHTVCDWGWFSGSYGDRFCFPMFSVNYYDGQWLVDNKNTATVTGSIDQQYREQTIFHPGVISHNVVAYRNISHSPGNAIAVLSNRMDGWWSETPGDSGVGGAILLGIAKYMNDNGIIPKYNLEFLFTTGEEYGMRGAVHYIDSHPYGTTSGKYNFLHWIGMDQLGFSYTTSTTKKLTFEIYMKNPFMYDLIEAIVDETNYEERTRNNYIFEPKPETCGGSEDHVWKDNCRNTLCFEKDSVWDGWHRTGGIDYENGDSLANIDPNDVQVTSEIYWNITKYFVVNPNCSFNSVTFEAVDSSFGSDEPVPNSLKATFVVKSVLPSDRVLVTASLINAVSDMQVPNAYEELDLVIDNIGVQREISFSLPPNVNEGDYYMKLEVYNSTGRINRSLGLPFYADDTITSQTFRLSKYPTLGEIRIGNLQTNVHNYIRGSKYTPTKDILVHNITAYVYGTTGANTPIYQCMIYRWSDGQLMGATAQMQKTSTGWMTFTFDPRPILQADTAYALCIWGDNAAYVYSCIKIPGNGYSTNTIPFGTPPPRITWNGAVMLRQHSLFCHYGLDLYPPEITDVTATPHIVRIGNIVTITANVCDTGSGLKEVKVLISDPFGREGNYTMIQNPEDPLWLYSYEYIDTRIVGQYNYHIWAQDNETNSKTSLTYHFHVTS